MESEELISIINRVGGTGGLHEHTRGCLMNEIIDLQGCDAYHFVDANFRKMKVWEYLEWSKVQRK